MKKTAERIVLEIRPETVIKSKGKGFVALFVT